MSSQDGQDGPGHSPRRLSDVSSADLEIVRHNLLMMHGDAVLTPSKLRRWSLERSAPTIARALHGLDRTASLRVLEHVLAERDPARRPRLQLVWTGDDSTCQVVRDTAALVESMFRSARERVLVAGYSFDHGKRILAPLHAVMQTHDVDVRMIVNVRQEGRRKTFSEAKVAASLDAFIDDNWPFGEPLPALYYDARITDPDDDDYFSMHAKCIVVDGAKVLIGSANFTDRAQSRNVEIGVFVEDPRFAAEVETQFERGFRGGRFILGG